MSMLSPMSKLLYNVILLLWWQMQQIAAGGGRCRNHTKRLPGFVHPLIPELRRKQCGWRHLPWRTHPDPHRYGRCLVTVWSQIAAIYSSLEEASLYSLLDYCYSVGMTRFYPGGRCRHAAAKLPPFRQRYLYHQSEGVRRHRLRCHPLHRISA